MVFNEGRHIVGGTDQTSRSHHRLERTRRAGSSTASGDPQPHRGRRSPQRGRPLGALRRLRYDHPPRPRRSGRRRSPGQGPRRSSGRRGCRTPSPHRGARLRGQVPPAGGREERDRTGGPCPGRAWDVRGALRRHHHLDPRPAADSRAGPDRGDELAAHRRHLPQRRRQPDRDPHRGSAHPLRRPGRAAGGELAEDPAPGPAVLRHARLLRPHRLHHPQPSRG